MSDQQTPLVYPVSETSPPTHHESNGSFGAVFIVLAVIVVVSAVACFLGRLCNKRHKKSKPVKHSHTSKPPKEKDLKHNRNAFQTKDGDIEFGFDKKFSSAKVAANGEPMMGRPNSFREPNMGRPNSFREPNMGRPDSFREPSMGRPDSFRGPAMGRAGLDSFQGPAMGQSNSFRKGEFRGDQVRFAGDQDHEMDFRSGPGPQHY